MELRYENVSWEAEGEPGSQAVALDLHAQPPSCSLDPHVRRVYVFGEAAGKVLNTVFKIYSLRATQC